VGKGQQGGTQDHYLQRCVLVLLGNLLAEGTIVNFDVQKTGGEKKYVRKIFLDSLLRIGIFFNEFIFIKKKSK